MKVVNKYRHTPGPDDVWVMRPGSNRPVNGGRALPCLSNPFHIGRDGTRDEVIAKYRRWLGAKVKVERDAEVIAALRGIPDEADLVCCCAPLPCHGEVIVQACRWLKAQAELKEETMKETVTYAGIGSRTTPPDVLARMKGLGRAYAERGYTLRSGGAAGADSAFEQGCGTGAKEIYLPWRGFNGNPSPLFGVDEAAVALACRFHPLGENLRRQSQGVVKLMARNGYQVLGPDLATLSDLVICWTPGGAGGGGTGQAIRIARAYNVPVFDLGSPSALAALKEFMGE